LFWLAAALLSYSETKEHWVDLSWNASTLKTVTSYAIYRRGQSEKSWTKIGSTAETTFADHDVKAREKYVYKVLLSGERRSGSMHKRDQNLKIPGKIVVHFVVRPAPAEC